LLQKKRERERRERVEVLYLCETELPGRKNKVITKVAISLSLFLAQILNLLTVKRSGISDFGGHADVTSDVMEVA
jgi:hypothetical protein